MPYKKVRGKVSLVRKKKRYTRNIYRTMGLLNSSSVSVSNGEYKIVYSNTFNVVGEQFEISFWGLTFQFFFQTQPSDTAPIVRSSFENNKLKLTFLNFRNTAGVSMTAPMQLAESVLLPDVDGVLSPNGELTGAPIPKRLLLLVKSTAINQIENYPLEVVVTFLTQDMPPPVTAPTTPTAAT